MTWNAFARREEILRAVVDTADRRLDGNLPTDLPGVTDTFPTDTDLVSALLLKWHTRLSGNVERILMAEPMGLEESVAAAWRRTAEQMPGVRLILDRAGHLDNSTLKPLVQRAQEREWVRLAMAAGVANNPSPAAAAAGRRLEETARAGLVLAGQVSAHAANESFVRRLKAALAA
ncbi:MAG: hypothetical protein ABIN79_09455 [Marmoricola sp.]